MFFQASTPAMGSQRENFDFNTLGGGAYCWLDFDDQSTLFQDTGATTPVRVLGDPILLVTDKSGNARNWSNASSATSPVWSWFGEGDKNAANFLDGTRYLSSSSPAVFNILYRGGPFTAVFNLAGRRRKVSSPQVILDCNDVNRALNGGNFMSSIDGTYSEAYYMYLSNNLTHTSGSGKSETTVPDPEYMYNFVSNSTTSVGVAFAGDVNNAYIKINSLPAISTPALGSPAPADSPYAARLGAAAFSADFGWLGLIRRVVIWNSFLSSADLQTAIDMARL